MSAPYPPGPPFAAPSAGSNGRMVLGIISLCLGLLTCCGGGCIGAVPFGLFFLGGGGNTEAFGEFARGPLIVGGIIFVLSLVPVILGLVLLLRRGRS